MSHIVSYCLNMKRLKWMIFSIMLSACESISVAVLSSYFSSRFDFISISMLLLNIPTVVGFSADIYHRYRKNQETRLMGLILSVIGGIDLVIWLMPKPLLWVVPIPWKQSEHMFISIVILCIIKVLGFVTNQIIARNLSDKKLLIIWIAVTIIDCMALFPLLFIKYDQLCPNSLCSDHVCHLCDGLTLQFVRLLQGVS